MNSKKAWISAVLKNIMYFYVILFVGQLVIRSLVEQWQPLSYTKYHTFVLPLIYALGCNIVQMVWLKYGTKTYTGSKTFHSVLEEFLQNQKSKNQNAEKNFQVYTVRTKYAFPRIKICVAVENGSVQITAPKILLEAFDKKLSEENK